MQANSQCVCLPDGRRLGVVQAGDLHGEPFFFFHGFSASRLSIHPDNGIPWSLGVRVISVDRPGIGLSDRQANRTLMDWPDDVAALADAMGIERFGVIGFCGGGPHALACAYRMPERVSVAGLVSSAPSIADPEVQRELPGSWRWIARAARSVTAALRLYFWYLARRLRRDPKGTMNQRVSKMAAPDQTIATNPKFSPVLLGSAMEAFARGSRGVAEDALVLARPWGFRPEQITVPVKLWYGEMNNQWPVRAERRLAESLPTARKHFYPNAGHLLYLTHWQGILQEMAL